MYGRRSFCGMLLLFACMSAPDAAAQSTSAGVLAGTVTGEDGAGIYQAQVVAVDSETGLTHSVQTRRDGSFRIPFLPPSEFRVLAERLGYRPHLLLDVPIRTGSTSAVAIGLVAAPPPVERMDTSVFAGRAPARSRTAGSRHFDASALRDIPHPRRETTQVLRLSSVADSELRTEGLHSRLSEFRIGGIPFETARHGILDLDARPAVLFPRSAVRSSDLVIGPADVEWSGAAAGHLQADMRRGGPGLRFGGFASWSGAALASAGDFEDDVPGHAALRAGLTAETPLMGDRARLFTAFEARRDQSALPAPWARGGSADQIAGIASSSYGEDLSAYQQPVVLDEQVVSATARFDWPVNDRHTLAVHGGVAAMPRIDSRDPLRQQISATTEASGNDAMLNATLSSTFSRRFGQELRVAIDRSVREYAGGPLGTDGDGAVTDLPRTVFAEGGLHTGANPLLFGKFERLEFRAGETLHYRRGAHRLKGGFELVVPFHRQEFTQHRSAVFHFGGAADFAAGEGRFRQTVGPLPGADFHTIGFDAFLQDRWTPRAGLELTAGARFGTESLPGELGPNQQWRDAAGTAGAGAPDRVTTFGPRLGVRWDPGANGEWTVEGTAGFYNDRMDPGLVGEALVNDGGLQVRRGLGTLASWPQNPGFDLAPSQGSVLTLLSGDFSPPRTRRATLALTRTVNELGSVSLSATMRRTDRLPRRRDANLPPGQVAFDQNERPIYGTLVQQGSLLSAEPGSNRSVSGFDQVWLVDDDAWSEYVGITAEVEARPGAGLQLLASYTWSDATDTWIGAGAGIPEARISPFRSGRHSGWGEAAPDYSTPHRVSAGAILELPGRFGPVVSGLYRYRSGYPFTPGFRDGVDANADGSGVNDPAYIDPGVSGMNGVLSEWECLEEQRGGFAERNSCRAPGVHALDARVEVSVYRGAAYSASIFADGLNLVSSEAGPRDDALLLVDPTRELQFDPNSFLLDVPLVANPDFGEPLPGFSSPRAIRIGARLLH